MSAVPYTMAFQGITFQGVRYSLFAYNARSSGNAGFADFDSIDVNEPDPHRLPKSIPYGKEIELRRA
ncbi:MAG: beta-xylosidase [Bryobacterales bacterium]|nr:beta-xylosidase [Bryobacterales bacterium]